MICPSSLDVFLAKLSPRAAISERADEMSDVHGEYLDTCAQLVIEDMIKK